ncbi:MAG: PepSY-associated TM helix domain-containing protein [Acidimicrobiales bacterium]
MTPPDTDAPLATIIDESVPTRPPSTTDRRAALAELRQQRPSRKNTTHRIARWLHVYTSMIALLIVLFFAVTGITLNHPTWVFGDEASETLESGTLPFATTTDDGNVDWLSIAEYVRTTYDVKGSVDNFSTTGSGDTASGVIVFLNPGYSADLNFDLASGDYDLRITQQGIVAVMNDLHKGRDAGSGWKWVIDVSAGFLVLISLTGLVMQFFLRKRRRSALTIAVLGGAVSIALMLVTLA